MTDNYRVKCEVCGGTGRRSRIGVFSSVCSTCAGMGSVVAENVEQLNIVSRVDCDADQLLRQGIGQLDKVVIVGYDKKGNEFYASNVSDGANALWHLQRGIHNLMTIVDKGDLDE